MQQSLSRKLDVFDSIELFSSQKEVAYFPFHTHDYYCVSLITEGTEVLNTEQSNYFIRPHSVSITQANELHKNEALGDFGYSYHTVYVNPDILAFYNDGKPVAGLKRVIQDVKVANSMHQLANASSSQETILASLFTALVAHQSNREEIKSSLLPRVDLLDALIAENSEKLLKTDWLATQFGFSQYHFIREFKKLKGVSPQAYITLRRLQKSMEELKGGRSIMDVAFANGFYDLSHFSRKFKAYFGVTPGAYVQQCDSNFVQ